ncbi:MAG: hypothetical protein HXS41_14850 [Theionarchaea archaeon]|nr:hypothetical protein [Theionarchaea archaeon]MBU6999422.1 hypothetical protein [Theionarchaea archaeon]MBU7022329.1 hypothetical protein [Theionarchaea archaeon]MBU7036024.1 hypothetical protein [Theionarchaea archaeon]
MKANYMVVLSMLLLLNFSASVGALSSYSSSPSVPQPPNSNGMMAPLAQTTLSKVLSLQEKTHSLLDQAMEQDLDVEDIEALISEADALVEKAKQIILSNPIAALNMLRQAAEIYENAISDLEALLG